jgi:hypothetical protein
VKALLLRNQGYICDTLKYAFAVNYLLTATPPNNVTEDALADTDLLSEYLQALRDFAEVYERWSGDTPPPGVGSRAPLEAGDGVAL